MKETVGLIEAVKVIGTENSSEELAKFDTGAMNSSIDKELAEKLGLGEFVRNAKIKSASAGSENHSERPVHKMKVEIRGKVFDAEFNIADRSHFKQKIFPRIYTYHHLSFRFFLPRNFLTVFTFSPLPDFLL